MGETGTSKEAKMFGRVSLAGGAPVDLPVPDEFVTREVYNRGVTLGAGGLLARGVTIQSML